MKKHFRSFWLLLALMLSNCNLSFSQTTYNTIIRGKVIDAKTREALPYVSVFLENTTVGTLTDNKGMYNISTSKTSYKVTFSFLGYIPESRIVTPGRTQVINIELSNSSIELNEVQIKASKKSYSNKNNPSVELIEKVIQNKRQNRKESLDYYNYEKYEKVVFALSDISKKFEESRIFSKYDFIFDNLDTSRQDGKHNLPLFIKEKNSSFFFRKSPRSEKEIVHGDKTINLDEYIDIKGLTANLDYLYQNIDIYDNEIFFLTNKFLSPVASTAPVLYRFYIQDTTFVENDRCIKLFFEPRNSADFLFHGFLYITDDNRYAIRKIDMSFNKKINIDWIKDVRIIQDFKEIGEKTWLLTDDEITVDFGVVQNLPGVTGRRTVTYNDYAINEQIPDSIFKGPDAIIDTDATNKDLTYWDSVRNPPLSTTERNLYGIIDSVKKVPEFKKQAKIMVLLTTNFLDLGKVEIGPDVSFVSYNPIEGTRIRFGGRTTPFFSKTIYLESYLAYGFQDKQYKYNIVSTFSLNKKSIYKFPVKTINLSYKYDTQIPGQDLLSASPDNFFYSFNRGVNDKMVYNRTFSIEHLNELENHFSYDFGFSFTRQIPAGNLYYTTNGDLPFVNEVPFLQIPEVFVKLRYAPKEEFYQGKIYRYRIPSKYPVIQFNYTLGSKSMGNDYNYQKLSMDIGKRFYLSIIGYTDVSAEAGLVLGTIPFPLLTIHSANQSYAYEVNSYNLMNFMEFVSDKYVSLQVDHSFNGFFFNKIPLLKKFKLREVMSLKVLYGGVGDRNNPDLNPDLFKFPVDINGVPLTYPLDRKPYIEGSIGVSNLFRILRVDFVKRFSYLENPNITSFGVRLRVKFDF